AQKLVGQLIESSLYSKGSYPEKVAFSLWGGEFIRGEGVNIAQILYLLGIEPVWNSRGRVYDVKLIPTETLGRPRIDVFVQTSGQFRDLATSRIYLIEKAIRIASEARGTESLPNYVRKGTDIAEKVLKQKGFSPEEARIFSTVRVFGGINGQYGTGIMPLVEDGDAWENDSQIAAQYM
ncbi:cobaltochelatase subunit CobN, partial [Arthrospira platensis SPKY1]|nr:cobaltochelatase subunit CobN [Arthrospira platensis SPKY1]